METTYTSSYFAANDINTTSRAATESQLNDLYSAVAAYDVNVDGTIDYSHIAFDGQFTSCAAICLGLVKLIMEKGISQSMKRLGF